jgi:hypothetical protein
MGDSLIFWAGKCEYLLEIALMQLETLCHGAMVTHVTYIPISEFDT